MPTTLPDKPGVRFLPVAGFDGYAVGDDGSVWSRRPRPNAGGCGWRRIGDTPRNRARPYPLVCLVSPGGRPSGVRFFAVHSLVLHAFVGPCPAGFVCRHLDGDGQNNRLGNLRWGTESENRDDSRRHGTMVVGSRHRAAKLTEAQIPELRAFVAAGHTQGQAAAMFGVCRSTVSRILSGEKWKHTNGEHQ